MTENEIAKIVVEAASHVHKDLRLGFFRIGLRDGISRIINGL